eukprot:4580171-Pleurochrysis_carterae.AAC.1
MGTTVGVRSELPRGRPKWGFVAERLHHRRHSAAAAASPLPGGRRGGGRDEQERATPGRDKSSVG